MMVDSILLNIPAKPEYVMVVRLTTSAVACRAGLRVDEIEDLKVAVAESCNILMNQTKNIKQLNVNFNTTGEGLKIEIGIEKDLDDIVGNDYNNYDEQNELGIYIITSLITDVNFHQKGDIIYSISMYKKSGGQTCDD
jgi:serine/threonine-protein kinase RsbW